MRRSKNCRPLSSTPRLRPDRRRGHSPSSINLTAPETRALLRHATLGLVLRRSLVEMVAPPEAIRAIATPAAETAAQRSPSS
jgi:hypothetical protein